MTTLTPKQEEIAERAYHLYLKEGCQHGRDLEYWFRAEKELGSHFFTPPVATQSAKPVSKVADKKPAVAPAKKKPAAAPAKKTAVKKAAPAPAKKAARKKA